MTPLEAEKKMIAEYNRLTEETLAEVEKQVENMPLVTALEFARQILDEALESVKSATFGIADAKPTQHVRRKREQERLVRAKMEYAKALTILRRLEKSV
jgi:hypothetical protein